MLLLSASEIFWICESFEGLKKLEKEKKKVENDE